MRTILRTAVIVVVGMFTLIGGLALWEIGVRGPVLSYLGAEPFPVVQSGPNGEERRELLEKVARLQAENEELRKKMQQVGTAVGAPVPVSIPEGREVVTEEEEEFPEERLMALTVADIRALPLEKQGVVEGKYREMLSKAAAWEGKAGPLVRYFEAERRVRARAER